MYVIVGEIVVCLKSGFELEAPYMVFIVRKWPGGTTICDLFSSGKFPMFWILSAKRHCFEQNTV